MIDAIPTVRPTPWNAPPLRRTLSITALAALCVNEREPEFVTGMAGQGYRLHLTNVERMWRTTSTGGRPMVSGDGFEPEPEPPRELQR